MKGAYTQRIILAELSMTGGFHTTVNTGFIRWMHAKNPEANLYFFAEQSHIKICKKQLEDQAVQYRKFPYFPRANKFTLPFRDLLGTFYAIFLFVASQKNDILFITNLLPITHWCIYILNLLFCRNTYIVLHGQLEALLPNTRLKLTKIYFRLHKPLLRRDRKSQYLILGEPIYEVLKNYLCTNTQIVIIDHPYKSSEETLSPPMEFPLRFGQIGVGNRGKGTENLFRLGELLYKEIEEGKLELHLIGRLDRELRNRINPWVKWHEKSLSNECYDLEIKKLNYALFLRDADTGLVTPSGSFFDAIKSSKQFLALENPYIKYYIHIFPGNGTICRSIEEMAEEIRKIINTC